MSARLAAPPAAELAPRKPGLRAVWDRTAMVVTSSGMGSCVWIDASTAVTSAHVVAHAQQIAVGGPAGFQPVSCIAADYSTDLAILRASIMTPRTRANFAGLPSPGDDLWFMGHPLGADTRQVHRATASGFAPLATDGTNISCIALDAAVNCGNSGGPLCDEKGRIVGIIAAKSPRIPNVGDDTAQLVAALNALINNGRGFAVPISRAGELMDYAQAMQQATWNRFEKYAPRQATVPPEEIAQLQAIAHAHGSNPLGPFSFDSEGTLQVGWSGSPDAALDDELPQFEKALLRASSTGGSFFLEGDLCWLYRRQYGGFIAPFVCSA